MKQYIKGMDETIKEMGEQSVYVELVSGVEVKDKKLRLSASLKLCKFSGALIELLRFFSIGESGTLWNIDSLGTNHNDFSKSVLKTNSFSCFSHNMFMPLEIRQYFILISRMYVTYW